MINWRKVRKEEKSKERNNKSYSEINRKKKLYRHKQSSYIHLFQMKSNIRIFYTETEKRKLEKTNKALSEITKIERKLYV